MNSQQYIRAIQSIAIVSVLFLAGCAVHQPMTSDTALGAQHTRAHSQGEAYSQPSQTTAPGSEDKTAGDETRYKTVPSLVRDANALAYSGHLDKAAKLLHKAADIAPENPLPYQHLAVVYLAQDNAKQALIFARKAITKSDDQSKMQAQNWMLVSQACKLIGDAECNRDAQIHVRDIVSTASGQ